jgi:hypothetical protein
MLMSLRIYIPFSPLAFQESHKAALSQAAPAIQASQGLTCGDHHSSSVPRLSRAQLLLAPGSFAFFSGSVLEHGLAIYLAPRRLSDDLNARDHVPVSYATCGGLQVFNSATIERPSSLPAVFPTPYPRYQDYFLIGEGLHLPRHMFTP